MWHAWMMSAVLAALLACSVGSVGAATFNVTKTADTADGACDADCSLREAVIAANQSSGGDEIVLPAGTFQLTRDDTAGDPFGTLQVDDLNEGGPDALTIRGAGRTSTIVEQTISPDPAGILQVAGDLTEFVLADMTLRGGFGVDGAALLTFAPTTIERVTFTECSADDDGGAVMNFAPLVVRQSVFADNFATDDAGALMTFDVATISDTTFDGNDALGNGGALMPFEELTLERVTFSNNRAGNSGGAMMTFAPVTVINGTFSNNQGGVAFPTGARVAPSGGASHTGGAIHAFEPLRLVHATVTGNTGPGGGGGIFNAYRPSLDADGADPGPTAVELAATIVAGNTPDDCLDDPFGAPVAPQASLGHVLDSDGSCVSGAAGDQTAADPGLAPLADNGGPSEPATKTHALEPGSPAIDAAGGTCAAAADQRGVARPMDGDENGSVLCDIGAFEVAGASATTTTTTLGGNPTTTTTLPGPCDGAVSFESILCRLDALVAATEASDGIGKAKTKLTKAAGKARDLTVRGRDKCAAGDAKAGKKSGRDLKKAGRKLTGYRRGLTSNKARKTLDAGVREGFLVLVEPLIDDVKSFRGGLVCPDDASPRLVLQPRR